MELQLFGLKVCDTCKKAQKTLSIENVITFIDVRENPLSEQQVSEYYHLFGDVLVNTRSTTWRGLNEVERQEPAVSLLLKHPTLMKRPVITGGAQPTLGWTKDVQGQYGLG